jgi:hypothetical protein
MFIIEEESCEIESVTAPVLIIGVIELKPVKVVFGAKE